MRTGGTGWWAWVNHRFASVKPRVSRAHFYGRATLYVFFFVWGWQFILMEYDVLVAGSPEIGDSFMHWVNLVFHEAGHMIFMPFGRFIALIGGTLNQLLIPFIVMCAFLRTGDTFGASIGLWWLGQSFMDVAPYINDARAGELALLGGGTSRDRPGDHDWQNILSDLQLLEYDHAIARIVDTIGEALVLLALLWGAYVLYLQYKNLDRPVLG